MKCQVCRTLVASWSWQPFGPGEDAKTFTLPGSHYHGFPIIKVCEICKKDIKAGSIVQLSYREERYICQSGKVRAVKDLTIERDALEAFRNTVPQYRRYETYTLLAYRWDIVRAHYLIHTFPRDPVEIEVAGFAQVMGFPFIEGGAKSDDTPPEDSGLFYVDTKVVRDDRIDLSRPLICALIQIGRDRPGTALIDGLARLYKAAWRGIPHLPAYMIAPDEEQICRF